MATFVEKLNTNLTGDPNTSPAQAIQNQYAQKIDNSSGVTQVSNGTYRGFGSDWFNAENIAAEDWNRAELAAKLAFDRESAFNAAEAQKQRDFEERMSSTAYQRAVADMKKAGINPVMLAANFDVASTPAGSAASSSSGGHSRSGARSGDTSKLVGSLLALAGQIIAGRLSVPSGKYTSTKIGFGK